jgi:hypothetical protein
VNIAEGLVTELNCDEEVLGPLLTVHVPVPTEGVFAAIVAKLFTQIVWFGPAFAVVGLRLNVTVTSSELDVHGLLDIVHLRT